MADQDPQGRPASPPSSGPRSSRFMAGRQLAIPAHWIKQVTSGIANVFRTAGEPSPNPGPTTIPPAPPSPAGAPVPVGLSSAVPVAAPGPPTAPPAPPDPGPQPMQQPARPGVWMGPGQSMTPVAPRDGVAGREMDFAVGYNLGARPRRQPDGGLNITFEQLTGLADACNLVDLCIATRQDQMAALKWSCVRRKKPDQKVRDKPDERCTMIEDFFRRPDRRTPFATWFRSLLWAVLVHDAPALYVRKTRGGEPYALEIMDGTTIDVKLDETGRIPMAPSVAYQQILKGNAAVNYTTDELLYWPRNLRPGQRYGRSPVEQIILTVEISLRRELARIQYFTEGNVPEALISTPKDWTPEQIHNWQLIWDAMMADQSQKRKMKFVPGDMQVHQTRASDALSDGMDEWFARVICWAFSLPPTALVKMMNRATAESAYEAALTEGLQPLIEWAKTLLDHIVQNVFGFTDLEMEPDDIRRVDPIEQQQHDLGLVDRGLMSYDDFCIKAGMDPVGLKEPFIRGIGPNGLMFVSDILRAKKMGFFQIQPPMAPDTFGGMGGGMGGAPSGLMPPDASGAVPGAMPPDAQGTLPDGRNPMIDQLLAGVNPEILNAVGMGAEGKAGRTIDITEDDALGSDPLTPHAADPKIVTLLRDAEGRLGKRAPPRRRNA